MLIMISITNLISFYLQASEAFSKGDNDKANKFLEEVGCLFLYVDSPPLFIFENINEEITGLSSLYEIFYCLVSTEWVVCS